VAISETFSEGTSFQPLIICLVFKSRWGIERTLRVAVASLPAERR